MARAREDIGPRLDRSCRVEGGCWIWTGSKTRDGYGVITIGRHQHRAHRVSYAHYKGVIPEGRLVCHACDTPLCINPEHLFLGSAAENTADMIAKGRRAVRSGLDHHNTQISPAGREEVRRLRAGGATLASIAERYGVSFQTISSICKRTGSYAARN